MVTPGAVPAVADLGGGSLIESAATFGPYGVAAAVAIVLLALRPTVTRWTVLAIVPWALVAAGLHAYATVAVYPAAARPLFEVPQAYLLAFAFAGFAWISMLEFGTARRGSWDPSVPLATMGVGMASVLVAGTILGGGVTGLRELSVLPIVLVVAATVAGVTYLAFGLLYADAVAYTGLAGGLAVFGHALDGIATSVGISAFPWIGHTRLSATADSLAPAVADHLGVSQLHAWTALLLWMKLAFAVLVVVALARYARERPTRANVALGGITAAGIVPGATTLLLVLTGG